MSEEKRLRFVTAAEAERDDQGTRVNEWLSKPGMTEAEGLMMARVQLQPGDGHAFHRHPALEEIIYVISGRAEQWVEREMRVLGPGDIAHIPADMVHATHNSSDEPLTILAILSPAKFEGPFAIDVFDEEPWRSLRAAGGGPAPEAR